MNKTTNKITPEKILIYMKDNQKKIKANDGKEYDGITYNDIKSGVNVGDFQLCAILSELEKDGKIEKVGEAKGYKIYHVC